jgi:serine/threonine-protein kinase
VLAEKQGSEKLTQSAHRTKTDILAKIENSRLGPWILESLLGESANTRVYSARPTGSDHALPACYAVKVLREHWNDEPAAVQQMRHESLVGRSVAHRRVVSILSAHVHQPPYYVVMPWIKGINLTARLAARGKIAAPVALWIARQAAEALEALHNSGYLHGDVKPANLLVDNNGHVTLIDLGHARRWPDEPTLNDQPLAGTPHYLAPEAFAGRPCDPRSDLYSLGITLFEMLAGRLPTTSNDIAFLSDYKRHGVLPSVRAFSPQVASEVSGFIRHLTARDPLRRPRHAREVAYHLMRLEIASLRERVPA